MPTPGAPGSSTETFHALRPIPKKAPLPPPPSFNEEKPQAAKPMPVKAEPGPDYGEELSPPDPPPGEHWEEYVDGDNTWFFYSGPKGQWCCQGYDSIWMSCDTDYSHQKNGCKPPQKRYNGDIFNSHPGTMVAEWNDQNIKIWHFPAGTEPADLFTGDPRPATWDPTHLQTWFPFEDHSCKGLAFGKQELVINTDLCGQFAGNTWELSPLSFLTGYRTFYGNCKSGQDCCEKWIQDPRSAQYLRDYAFWDIDWIKVPRELSCDMEERSLNTGAKTPEERGPVGSLPPWSLRAPLLPVMAWTTVPFASSSVVAASLQVVCQDNSFQATSAAAVSFKLRWRVAASDATPGSGKARAVSRLPAVSPRPWRVQPLCPCGHATQTPGDILQSITSATPWLERLTSARRTGYGNGAGSNADYFSYFVQQKREQRPTAKATADLAAQTFTENPAWAATVDIEKMAAELRRLEEKKRRRAVLHRKRLRGETLMKEILQRLERKVEVEKDFEFEASELARIIHDFEFEASELARKLGQKLGTQSAVWVQRSSGTSIDVMGVRLAKADAPIALLFKSLVQDMLNDQGWETGDKARRASTKRNVWNWFFEILLPTAQEYVHARQEQQQEPHAQKDLQARIRQAAPPAPTEPEQSEEAEPKAEAEEQEAAEVPKEVAENEADTDLFSQEGEELEDSEEKQRLQNELYAHTFVVLKGVLVKTELEDRLSGC
ncbi:hypothetical protein AK812_SmicGene10600 [Symbiodinium microadriaticum]|uniref:Uncharacterized protein n=1 Tax=Symbiodinium microadriaticum TaxID=2951 RepID=A0A1Q9EFF7_SYMMI|nr:hypothetical protein AK812_SmicGene10600 [Symbiodinium microadriaticum]